MRSVLSESSSAGVHYHACTCSLTEEIDEAASPREYIRRYGDASTVSTIAHRHEPSTQAPSRHARIS